MDRNNGTYCICTDGHTVVAMSVRACGLDVGSRILQCSSYSTENAAYALQTGQKNFSYSEADEEGPPRSVTVGWEPGEPDGALPVPSTPVRWELCAAEERLAVSVTVDWGLCEPEEPVASVTVRWELWEPAED